MGMAIKRLFGIEVTDSTSTVPCRTDIGFAGYPRRRQVHFAAQKLVTSIASLDVAAATRDTRKISWCVINFIRCCSQLSAVTQPDVHMEDVFGITEQASVCVFHKMVRTMLIWASKFSLDLTCELEKANLSTISSKRSTCASGSSCLSRPMHARLFRESSIFSRALTAASHRSCRPACLNRAASVTPRIVFRRASRATCARFSRK